MSEHTQTEGGLGIYRRLLKYVVPYWKIFIFAVIAMAVYATTDAAFAYVMKPMLDDSFVNRDPEAIKTVPLLIVAIFVVRIIANFISGFGMAWVGRNVIRDLRKQMFRQLLQLPISFYDRSSSGTLIAKLLYDVEQLAQASSKLIITLIRDTLTIVALFGLMFYTSMLLSIVFVVLAPIMLVLVVKVGKRFRKLSRRIQGSMGNVSHITEEAVDGNRVIKIFGGQSHEEDQFAKINEYNRRQHLKLAAANAFNVPFVQLLVACAFALIVYMATLPDMREAITPGTFISFMTAMLLLMQPIRRLTDINVTLQQGIAGAQSVFEFLDQAPERDSGDKSLTRAKGKIEYSNVSFRYSDEKEDVLRDINLTINPGETVAFVGRSGSGKTTLVNLLPRFYETDRGTITLDDVDVRRIKLGDLRSQIALVSQQVTLFNDTIAHNIAYGDLAKRTSPDEIRGAAEAAYAMDFISQQPEGLETAVGQDGVMLSGGQRQRLAIARALLKDAPILILDEATSALDTESERYIQQALETLIENRTTLVIAHRLSTVESADKIVVLQDGRIVETGKHAELLAKEGVYASLYRMQFNESTEQTA
jgi:subfamily B ATP-binding cassette protein MsbA